MGVSFGVVTDKPFISFYDSIGFAPTRQDLSTATSHHQRRSILYRSLGIPDIAIRGSRVLEFGPGSGENCESVLRQKPSHYTLVDGSTAVLGRLRDRLDQQSDVPLSYVLSDIDQYTDEYRYDLVICEGVLPMQRNPRVMAEHILSFARPGGVVVMTCFDACSTLSEWCRRFIAQHLFSDMTYSKKLVEKLTEFFRPDLGLLPGVSRRPEDWVVDTLINPWVGEFFSLRDAIDVSQGVAAFLGSSPRFFQDFRWYKDPSNLDGDRTIELIRTWLSTHSYVFLDARLTPREMLASQDYSMLPAMATRLAKRIQRYNRGAEDYDVKEFGIDIAMIAEYVREISFETYSSLRGLVRWTEHGNVEDLAPFRSLWGRGQQFISFAVPESDFGG